MSGLRLLFIGWVVLMACIVAVALLRSRRRGGPMVVQPQAMPPMKGSLDAEAAPRGISVALGRELVPLLEQGRTDEAVALVRARTGASAEEARASVERLVGLMKRLGME